MGGLESNNAKMTLQNAKEKFQCNVTIVQSLHKGITENKSILKIQSDLCFCFSLMLIKKNGIAATILEP